MHYCSYYVYVQLMNVKANEAKEKNTKRYKPLYIALLSLAWLISVPLMSMSPPPRLAVPVSPLNR